MSQSDEIRYALRITPQMEQDVRMAFERFIEMSGIDVAQAWRSRLTEQIASLSTNPTRFPLVTEHRHFHREVRHLVFRRSLSSVAYRVLFWVNEGGDDAPTVVVFHLRHAAAKPLSRKDARAIQETE
jgi:plasmid stabilization system protein ParE